MVASVLGREVAVAVEIALATRTMSPLVWLTATVSIIASVVASGTCEREPVPEPSNSPALSGRRVLLVLAESETTDREMQFCEFAASRQVAVNILVVSRVGTADELSEQIRHSLRPCLGQLLYCNNEALSDCLQRHTSERVYDAIWSYSSAAGLVGQVWPALPREEAYGERGLVG